MYNTQCWSVVVVVVVCVAYICPFVLLTALRLLNWPIGEWFCQFNIKYTQIYERMIWSTSNVQSPQPLPMSIIQLKIEWMNFEFNFVGRMTEIWHFCRQSHWNWGANENELKIENTDVHYTDVRAIIHLQFTYAYEPSSFQLMQNRIVAERMVGTAAKEIIFHSDACRINSMFAHDVIFVWSGIPKGSYCIVYFSLDMSAICFYQNQNWAQWICARCASLSLTHSHMHIHSLGACERVSVV